MKTWLYISIGLLLPSPLAAQDTTDDVSPWSINGYVKDMQSLQFSKDFQSLSATNLLHNRINLRYRKGPHFIMSIESRNRIFWGDDVRTIPGFAKQLRNANEWLTLSKVWLEQRDYVIHTQIDRWWAEYRQKKWSVRIGRQRLNWGITTQWNPNDLFNTFNFLDFDYEERPGSDAVSLKYAHSGSANTTVAFTPGEHAAQAIGAVKHSWNRKGYDLQVLAGWYKNQLTIGGGWAGSIKEAGFKGEVQYFFSRKESIPLLNVSLEGDYAFKNGWYVNAGILYNDKGSIRPFNDLNGIDFRFTPKYLMPTRWNFLLASGKSFTPLLTGYITVLFAPGSDLLLFLPSIKYNLSEAIDIDWVWQSFLGTTTTPFSALGHRTFLRMKWNF